MDPKVAAGTDNLQPNYVQVILQLISERDLQGLQVYLAANNFSHDLVIKECDDDPGRFEGLISKIVYFATETFNKKE